MRKALIPAFLLVVAATVLGSTLFREQIVSAATTPFQNVVVTNTNPIPVQQLGPADVHVTNTSVPVHEQGTATVSGTVGIDPNANTVSLGASENNTLASSNAHLSNIDSATGKLNFDGNGNLKTTAQAAPPSAATGFCVNNALTTVWAVTNDHAFHTLCSTDFYITDITASGMDDALQVAFYLNGTLVYEIQGDSTNGAAAYQVDLTHPLHVDDVEASCTNASTSCRFTLALLGNTTGT